MDVNLSEDSQSTIGIMNSVSISPHMSLHCDDWVGQQSLGGTVRGMVFFSPRIKRAQLIFAS